MLTGDPGTLETGRTLRPAWVVLAVIAGFVTVLSWIGVFALVLNAQWWAALLGALASVGTYWFAVGAWRRTPWGYASPQEAPPDPPQLSERRALAYVYIGLSCVAAAAIALVLQAFVQSR